MGPRPQDSREGDHPLKQLFGGDYTPWALPLIINFTSIIVVMKEDQASSRIAGITLLGSEGVAPSDLKASPLSNYLYSVTQGRHLLRHSRINDLAATLRKSSWDSKAHDDFTRDGGPGPMVPLKKTQLMQVTCSSRTMNPCKQGTQAHFKTRCDTCENREFSILS